MVRRPRWEEVNWLSILGGWILVVIPRACFLPMCYLLFWRKRRCRSGVSLQG